MLQASSGTTLATSAALRIGMVVGEASGDLLASQLLAGLQAQWPKLRSMGIGGPRMQAAGFDAWWPSSKLSVFGYVDALRHLPELLGIRNRLGERLIGADRPNLFIGVDAPDFNFALETRLRQAGVKTVHFVCPSIWAWRGERVKKIAAAADHVLCLFPFEPEILQRHGIAATYVGHPMADAIPLEVPRLAARSQLGLGESAEVVALLPGSRKSEIQQIAPALLQAAVLMARSRPGLRFVLPMAPGMSRLLQPMLAKFAPGIEIQAVEGQSHTALAACDVTLIASGTATLEAALFKRPMVITYRLNWLNYRLMRGKAYLPWFGLPNVLCRDFVVPELIQDAATPEALAREGLAWLEDAGRVEKLRSRFTELHQILRQDTARKALDAITPLLKR